MGQVHLVGHKGRLDEAVRVWLHRCFAAFVRGIFCIGHFVEFLEIGAALGLILGVVLGVTLLARFRARTQRVEEQLKIAAGAFAQVLEDRFTDWGLTPAEKDVALFLVKGMSTSEISGLRNTSEGTIKAQTNAIYRKSGVNGRSQLLSLFIDDLMQDALVPTP